MNKKADVNVGNEGTIWTFLPVSDLGKQWIDDKVQAGDGVVVCHRCAHDMLEDGLDVRRDTRK